MALDIVIMAAGQGTRMKSGHPKVLHRLGGRSLLQHVLQAAAGLRADRIVVVTGHGAEAVEAACAGRPNGDATAAGPGVPGTSAPVAAAELRFVRQSPQLGTGHAVQQALPLLHDAGTTLILNGDVPLLETATARALVDASAGERLALLTFEPGDPTGYGRIVRDPAGSADARPIRGIVEQRDASPAQRAIREVYTGVMAAPTAALRRWLATLSNDNAQREYYLTDIVAMAVADGLPVVASRVEDEAEVLGVNSPAQLADLERRHQSRAARRLMDAHGVRLADPARFDLRGTLECGRDVEIDVNVVFGGAVVLGDDVRIGPNCVVDGTVHVGAGARIGPNCVLGGRVRLGDGVRIEGHCTIRDTEIGPGTVLLAYTHVDGDGTAVTIGADARVGPYARLRPGAQLGDAVHVGNFVEVKNTTLGRGAKANHLAYLGDASVGERVNFGAGSITANYDGVNKHRTTIGDDASIGSNCVLVAPVTIGAGATVGGGSTVAKNAPPGQLTVARARAVSYPNWTRPTRRDPR